MTREEATEELKILKEDYWDDDGYGHETKQYDDTMLALDMAIKALEKEPTAKNYSSKLGKNSKKLEKDFGKLDCVSRQAVDGLCWQYLRKETDETIAFYEHFLDLPSVTQIRPKGHWLPQNDDYCDWYECSECGYGSEGEMQCNSEHDVRTNYCPYCGADMRGEEE